MAPNTRRKRRKSEPAGKETYEIVTENGTVLKEIPHGEGPAVAWALTHALDLQPGAEWIVRLRPLFGPTDDLFVVRRHEVGTSATPISPSVASD